LGDPGYCAIPDLNWPLTGPRGSKTTGCENLTVHLATKVETQESRNYPQRHQDTLEPESTADLDSTTPFLQADTTIATIDRLLFTQNVKYVPGATKAENSRITELPAAPPRHTGARFYS